MSNTGYSTNHALTQKLWAKKLNVEALKEAYVSKFIGKSSDSMIQYREETNKSKGDKITVGLRMQLAGDGTSGDNPLAGNEESLVTYNDAIYIDQLRHAVRSDGKMSEQRVLFDIRMEAKSGLKDWWAGRFDTAFFNQICGNTAQTDVRYTGMQAVIAPDANHIIRAGNQANDQSVVTANIFNLTHLDVLIERATTLTPAIRPFMIDGVARYVCFLHPYQVTQMRTSTSTAQWADIQKAAMQGGQVNNNPIFTGALGMYNNIILHSSFYVTSGVNSSTGAAIATVKRASFCGAQAASIAFGGEDGPDTMSWAEEEFDYGNQLGVAVGAIWGLKKSTFNSADFGSIVLSTYGAATNPT
jgi:N4-gp56 family major capsid protein